MKQGSRLSVFSLIERSDIIIHVIDCRMPDLTINKEIEQVCRAKGKELIYAANKADLYRGKADKKIKGFFPVSSATGKGINALKTRISIISKGLLKKGKQSVLICVVGYPNTGKSSLINSLSKGGKTRTSPTSGFTRGVQLIKLKDSVFLMDSPGVIPFDEKDEVLLALIGAKDVSKIKIPEPAAEKIIEISKNALCSLYGIELPKKEAEDVRNSSHNEQDERLEAIILKKLASKLNYLLKRGIPDIDRAARRIISDWQKGRIQASEETLKNIKECLR